MISDRFSPADFLLAVKDCDLLRLQSRTEEELREVDLTCRRAWNDGRSVPSTAPRYLNFLRRLSAWLDAGGEARVRLSPDLRPAWRTMVVRLVEKGQLKPVALRSLGRRANAAAALSSSSHYGPSDYDRAPKHLGKSQDPQRYPPAPSEPTSITAGLPG